MKKKQNIHAVTRFVIQLTFFIFLPALFSAGFMGARYLAEQFHDHDVISRNPFLTTLAVLLVFTIVFGRFFCGYACAFGSFGDWLFTGSSFIQKKLRGKVFKLPDRVIFALQYLKYIVLIGILAACLTGKYSDVSLADPWGIFASFRAGDFSFNGHLYAGILMALILIGMCFAERFFCQFLCPLGAVFALLPMFPPSVFTRRKECCIKGCGICVRACSASISLGEARSKHGECFHCGKCSIKCPIDNIFTGHAKIKGTEIVPVAGKAVLLFTVCYVLLING